MEMDEQTRAYFAAMANRSERQENQLKALLGRYRQLATEHSDSQIQIKQLRDAVKKAAARIRYIEDIPGKRVPYFMQFSIPIPGPTAPANTLAGQRLSVVSPVSQDGPFVCTTYLAAFALKTFSIGPFTIGEDDGRPSDPPAGTEVITPLTGRWRPVASTADPFSGAYVGPGTGPINLASTSSVQTYRPGSVDFTFEIADEGVDRLRQNQIAIPSRYLFSEFDRPLYLPVSDFFERGSSIRFSATLLREVGFAEVNWPAFQNGFLEGDMSPVPDPTSLANPDSGRAIVSLGGTLIFTMMGYKILQAQSPAM